MHHRHKHGHPFWETWQAMGFESDMSPYEMARLWREHLHQFFGWPPEEH